MVVPDSGPLSPMLRTREGPRLQVATRPIAAMGQYNPFSVAPDITGFSTGAQMVSGTKEARRAVRQYIGNGADLIKIYADWKHPTLTVDEMCDRGRAHKQGRKVVAYAIPAQGIKNVVMAGVDSIMHWQGVDEDLEAMNAKNVFLVPTLGGIDSFVERHKNDSLRSLGTPSAAQHSAKREAHRQDSCD